MRLFGQNSSCIGIVFSVWESIYLLCSLVLLLHGSVLRTGGCIK